VLVIGADLLITERVNVLSPSRAPARSQAGVLWSRSERPCGNVSAVVSVDGAPLRARSWPGVAVGVLGGETP